MEDERRDRREVSESEKKKIDEVKVRTWLGKIKKLRASTEQVEKKATPNKRSRKLSGKKKLVSLSGYKE